MGKVLMVMPISFDVQKYLLLDWAESTSVGLSLINPETGFEMSERFENTSEIGLTMKDTPASGRRLGFATPATLAADKEEVLVDDDNRPTFEPEAVLVLQPGDTWILEVENAADMEKYKEVAGALSRKFDVDIQMSAKYMDNPSLKE